MLNSIKSLLISPLTVAASIFAGVLGGIYSPDTITLFESVGDIYISLLKVVVLPFLFATILVSVINLLRKDGSKDLIHRIVIGFLGSMVIASVIGILCVTLSGSEMTPEKKIQLGSLINDKDQSSDLTITLQEPMPEPAKSSFSELTMKFIPENIFATLDRGETLKIVIFCLIFGIALGNIKSPGLQIIIETLQSVQQASTLIFKFLNYLLPIALFTMIGAQVAKVGIGIFGTMIEFIYQQFLGGLLVVVAGTLLIWIRAGGTLAHVIRETKQAMIVAVSSRSSVTCIPYAQEALTRLHFDKTCVELTIPLSFTVNRIGSVVYYAITTVFIANIYGAPLNVSTLFLIGLGSILAGIASAGSTGLLTVATVAIVCDLIKLPSEAVVVLLIAVDPIVDMIRTTSHVQGNVGVAAFVSPIAKSI
jgi:proton glutamate symport protein